MDNVGRSIQTRLNCLGTCKIECRLRGLHFNIKTNFVIAERVLILKVIRKCHDWHNIGESFRNKLQNQSRRRSYTTSRTLSKQFIIIKATHCFKVLCKFRVLFRHNFHRSSAGQTTLHVSHQCSIHSKSWTQDAASETRSELHLNHSNCYVPSNTTPTQFWSSPLCEQSNLRFRNVYRSMGFFCRSSGVQHTG